MKALGVLVMLMLLVAGVAVGGSRAQAVPAASVAFEQCQRGREAAPNRCGPLVTPAAMAADEGPGGYENLGAVGANNIGGDVSPDHDFFDHFTRAGFQFAVVVLNEFFNHFFGRGLPITLEPMAAHLFDPR
ncbi:MAG: hypothetical protein ACT4P5_03990 [Armatimonadota bacterium]